MRKKNTALFFLIIAHSFLLGHILVPHHHHDTEICITKLADNQTESKDSDHNDCDTKTRHTCSVSEDALLSSSHQTKKNYTCFDCLKTDKTTDITARILPTRPSGNTEEPEPLRFSKQIPSKTAEGLRFCVILRAPPIV